MKREKSCDECCDRAEDEEYDGDSLSGACEGVGYGEGCSFGGFVVEPGGDEKNERRKRGEDVVFLAGGKREEKEWDRCPESEKETRAFFGREGADRDEGTEGFAPGDGAESADEIGAPGHDPDKEQSPEEIEGNGVVVARDAKIQIAEEMLVDEVEPEPAVGVAVCGLGNGPMAVREG